MLDYIILGMVNSNCVTGYEIKKHIENNIGVFVKASFGSLYPALKKLVARGCLTMREEPQGSRQKVIYNITGQGKKEFTEWLMSPVSVLDGQNASLVRIYFFDGLPAEARGRKLLELEITYENYLKKLETLEAEYSRLENKDAYYFKLSTLYYGICSIRESIRWFKHIAAGKPLKEMIAQE